MAISDIPGYVQGFIFANDPAYYDSGNNRFLDQSPFAAWSNNHLDITVGTPSFGTLGTGQGMVLDNTVQGRFIAPAIWDGSTVVVMKPNMTTNAIIYPVIFGWAASVASNSRLRITRASPADYRHGITLANAVTDATANIATDAGQVTAVSFSQQNRRAYATKDGPTIISGGAVADSGSGIPGFGNYTLSGIDGLYARFGNISGTIADIAPSVNTMVIAEMHFFQGDIINNSNSAVASVIAELKTKYGI